MIAAARLRRGAAASAHGAVRLVRDAVTTTRRAGVTGQILVRTDSAFFQHAFVTAVTKAGAWFSVGARQDTAVRRAIASIDPDAWVRIEYSQAVLDTDTGELVSAAEVAEMPYTAFTSHRTPVTGRLIVRRVPERNATKLAAAEQEGLFQVWRYHAMFTNNPAPLVNAESQHRGHAVVEQVIADLKAGPLAHLPSKSFQANGLPGCGQRVQPDPRHRGHRRREVHQGRRRDRAGQDHQHSRAGVSIRAPTTTAPTQPLALGPALADPLDHGHDDLTTEPPPPPRPEDPGEAGPDRRHRHARIPDHLTQTLRTAQRPQPTPARWIED